MLQCEAQVRQHVEGKSNKIYDSAAEGVGEGGEDGGGQGLKDDVDGYGKIDCLRRGVVVGAEERKEGKVDGCRQRGRYRGETEEQGQKAFLPYCEDCVQGAGWICGRGRRLRRSGLGKLGE